jgi:hypothetical protein
VAVVVAHSDAFALSRRASSVPIALCARISAVFVAKQDTASILRAAGGIEGALCGVVAISIRCRDTLAIPDGTETVLTTVDRFSAIG